MALGTNYTRHQLTQLVRKAGEEGLEPTTLGLTVTCDNHFTMSPNNSADSHEPALIKTLTHAPFRHIARQEGFEPTRVLRQMVLETITFDHSVTAALNKHFSK